MLILCSKIRERLDVPVPKVLASCSRSGESQLGAEYIVMEKAPGLELGQIWDKLKAREKLAIVKQIASINSSLANPGFHAIAPSTEDTTLAYLRVWPSIMSLPLDPQSAGHGSTIGGGKSTLPEDLVCQCLACPARSPSLSSPYEISSISRAHFQYIFFRSQ